MLYSLKEGFNDFIKNLKFYKSLFSSTDGQINYIDFWLKNLNESYTVNLILYYALLLVFGWFLVKTVHALLHCYQISGEYFKDTRIYLKHQKLVEKALQTIKSAYQFNAEYGEKIKELYPEMQYLDVNEFDDEEIQYFDPDAECTPYFEDVHSEGKFAEKNGEKVVEEPPTIVTADVPKQMTRARYSSRYGKYVKLPLTDECSSDDTKKGIFSRRGRSSR